MRRTARLTGLTRVWHALKVRLAHPTWGPRKVRAYLQTNEPGVDWPAASSIGDLFTAENLTVPRKRRRRVPASAPFGTCEATQRRMDG
jgi:hypothetical protein